jgi:hypothetical protein
LAQSRAKEVARPVAFFAELSLVVATKVTVAGGRVLRKKLAPITRAWERHAVGVRSSVQAQHDFDRRVTARHSERNALGGDLEQARFDLGDFDHRRSAGRGCILVLE